MNERFFPDTNQVEEQPKPTFNTFIFRELQEFWNLDLNLFCHFVY